MYERHKHCSSALKQLQQYQNIMNYSSFCGVLALYRHNHDHKHNIDNEVETIYDFYLVTFRQPLPAGVALIAAPLGCFVVWRRMAYFGEATAHAALLGIALSLALELPIFVGTLAAALLMAWVVTQLSGRELASDTLLGVTAHAGLALGLVVASFLTGVRIDLMAIYSVIF